VLGKDYEDQDCSLARALEVVGERWTLLILRDALYGVRRFNDFQAHLDIPKAILSDRLNGLVDDGVLDRLPDPEHRGRHFYRLTQAGKDLWPVVHTLMVWGDRYREGGGRVFQHAACGTPVDDSGMCPRCMVAPGPDDVLTVPRRRSGRDDRVAQALREPHRMLDPVPDR
jgi:DNA-binding HxlR family transcriptional regulator